mgnify:CR=1 FL=1
MMALSACKSAPQLRPIPAVLNVDADLQRAMASLGDPTLTFYVRPERIDEVEQALGPFLPEGAVQDTTALGFVAQQLTGIPFAGQLSTLGLDTARPIVGGAMTLDENFVESVTHGALIDYNDLPALTHARVLLPTLNPQTTMDALGQLAQSNKLLQAPFEEGWLKISPQGQFFVNNGVLIAAIPQEDTVRLEVGLLTFDIAEALGTLEAIAMTASTTNADPKEPHTPAMANFLEGSAPMAVHIDARRLSSAIVLSKLTHQQTIGGSQHQARDLDRHNLFISDFLDVQPLIWQMHGQDRRFEDVTISVNGLPTDLIIDLVQTLTPAAQEAHANAQRKRGSVYRARGPAPVFEAQINLDLHSKHQALPLRAWPSPLTSPAELRDSLAAMAYNALNDPIPLFNAPLGAQEIDDILPMSLSVVVQELQPSSHIQGPPRVVGAVAAQYPPGPLPQAITDFQKRLETYPRMKKLWHLDIQDQGDRQLVMLANHEAPQTLFEPSPQQGHAPDFAAHYNAASIKKLLKKGQDPYLLFRAAEPFTRHSLLGSLSPWSPRTAIVNAIENLSVTTHTAQACQSTRVVLRSAPRPRPLHSEAPPLYPTNAPQEPVPTTDDPSLDRCLLKASTMLQDTALYELSLTSPKESTHKARALLKEADKIQQCVQGSPKHSAAARNIKAGLLLMLARGLMSGEHIKEARLLASEACELGRISACGWVEWLKTPYPDDTLELVEVPWNGIYMGKSFAKQLTITQEGIYLDETRLGDASRLAEGDTNAPMGWLIKALKDTMPSHTGMPLNALEGLHVRLDAAVPWQTVERLLMTVTAAEHRFSSVFRSSSGALVAAGLYPDPPHPTLGKGYPYGQPALELEVTNTELNIIHQGKPDIIMKRSAQMGQLGLDVVKLAEATRLLRKKTGLYVFKVRINTDMDWKTALELLSYLQSKPEHPAGATPAEVRDNITDINLHSSSQEPRFIITVGPQRKP